MPKKKTSTSPAEQALGKNEMKFATEQTGSGTSDAPTPKTAAKSVSQVLSSKTTISTRKMSAKTKKTASAQSKETENSKHEEHERLTVTYLNTRELKHFEKVLRKKRDEVLRDLEILKASFLDENEEDSVNSSYSMHMADHGTETMDREQRFLFIARDEKYLSYIDKALERIKNKTYGICAVSGKPIPKARLEAVPHTAVRIEYKKRS